MNLSEDIKAGMRSKHATTTEHSPLPLVYACSGCSGAAQMANDLALRLDRGGLARMSCVAGIGGDVPAILQMARSARAILVLDGCRLHCARRCLERHAISIGMHIDLSAEGVRKRMGEQAPAEEVQEIWRRVVLPTLDSLQAA
jgi:uncharacterized metal-binding protein